MTGGGAFQGTVLLTARADSDGNASSHGAGDAEGKVSATIPSKDLKIVIDTAL
jgi:hypothetical protein